MRMLLIWIGIAALAVALFVVHFPAHSSESHLYSTLVICQKEATVCDLDHAVYAEQSPPIFDSVDECVDGALAHMHESAMPPQLKEDTEYQIDIDCQMTDEPA